MAMKPRSIFNDPDTEAGPLLFIYAVFLVAFAAIIAVALINDRAGATAPAGTPDGLSVAAPNGPATAGVPAPAE